MSMLGFRNAIKRYMKVERSRLKTKFMAGKDECPVHVEPDQWKKLKAYWRTELQQAKAAKMATARAHVKNYSSTGRKGKAGKEAALVSSVASKACFISYMVRWNLESHEYFSCCLTCDGIVCLSCKYRPKKRACPALKLQ